MCGYAFVLDARGGREDERRDGMLWPGDEPAAWVGPGILAIGADVSGALVADCHAPHASRYRN